MGFPLLIRDNKGVRPTDNGLTILASVREFLSQEEHIYQLASEIKELITGTIKIGTYSSIAIHWLPWLIKHFQLNYPNIKIQMVEGIRQEVTQWLDNREIDIAFISYIVPMEYKWICLVDDQMIAVLPSNHPMSHLKSYPIEMCNQENFIMPGLGKDIDILQLLQNHGLTPKITLSTVENFAAISMIEQGLGMSIMSELTTKNWQADVVKLPLEPIQSVSLGIAFHSIKTISPAAKRFIDYCRAAFL
jgi:DNA-binding transcriptional LysR family regulator